MTVTQAPARPAVAVASASPSWLTRLSGVAPALRIAGAVLVIVGTYLPWATFVFNEGAYPAQATLEFFTVPFGVSGFRLHLLLFGVVALVLALTGRVAGRNRILRGAGWGVVAITLVNLLYLVVEGGGLGAITVADNVAFGSLVTLVGGVALLLGAMAGGVEPRPELTWRWNPWLERLALLGIYLVLLMLVALTLTAGGRGTYAGAEFLSFLAALGGLLAALSGAGLLAWVSAISERHRVYSVVLLLVVALLLPLTPAGDEYWMTVATNIGVYAATAIGLNIVVGLAGLLDLGYVAFLGIGAFVAANLSGAAAAQLGFALPFPLVVIVAAIVAGIFGAIVGSPTLRVRGDYLAIVTLAFGEIFVRSAQNNILGLTGGSNAIPNVPPISAFGTGFDQAIVLGPLELPRGVLYYVLIVLVVAFVMLVFANLKNSRLGRAWIAIREDEDAARAMGIRTGPAKILAFLIGAALAGIAGAVFAHKTATVSYESFRFLESITLLAAVILGGMGTIPGAVLGASVLFVLPEKLREFADYRLLIFGLALVLIMRFRPQGLVSDRHRRAELAPDADGPPGAAVGADPASGRAGPPPPQTPDQRPGPTPGPTP